MADRHLLLAAAVLLPMDAEVSWHLPAGPRTYWRGTVTHLTCEFAT